MMATLLALTMNAGIAAAQDDAPRLTIQPKIGMAVSTLTGNGLKYDGKWKVGPAAGVELEWAFNNMQSLVVGLDYRSVGCNFDLVTGSSDDMAFKSNTTLDKFTLQYLALPVTHKVQLVPRLSLRLGVEVAGLLSARAKGHTEGRMAASLHPDGTYSPDDDVTKYQWTDFKVKSSEGIGDKFRNFTLYIPIGLSYEYRRFVASATYHWEVRSASYSPYQAGGVALNDGYKIHNQIIDLTIGYRIKLR